MLRRQPSQRYEVSEYLTSERDLQVEQRSSLAEPRPGQWKIERETNLVNPAIINSTRNQRCRTAHQTVGDRTEMSGWWSMIPGNNFTRRAVAPSASQLFPFALSSTRHPILFSTNKQSLLPFMSHAQPTVSSSSNFELIINNALEKYKKRTKNDLITHPLAAQLQSCDSPNAILAVLQQQVQGLDQSRSSDERLSRWLDPTVNVIYVLSSTVAAGVSLVCFRT